MHRDKMAIQLKLKRKSLIIEALNDAYKVLELEPIDRIETTYGFYLLLKTRPQALEVAEHGIFISKNLLIARNLTNEGVRSIVTSINEETASQLNIPENTYLVSLEIFSI